MPWGRGGKGVGGPQPWPRAVDACRLRSLPARGIVPGPPCPILEKNKIRFPANGSLLNRLSFFPVYARSVGAEGGSERVLPRLERLASHQPRKPSLPLPFARGHTTTKSTAWRT
jgi:hypothetical protein